jgi:hypothetical protein
MIADLGYTFTFGIHDHVILVRSLAVDVVLAVLLAHVPVFFGRGRTAQQAGPGDTALGRCAAPRIPALA